MREAGPSCGYWQNNSIPNQISSLLDNGNQSATRQTIVEQHQTRPANEARLLSTHGTRGTSYDSGPTGSPHGHSATTESARPAWTRAAARRSRALPKLDPVDAKSKTTPSPCPQTRSACLSELRATPKPCSPIWTVRYLTHITSCGTKTVATVETHRGTETMGKIEFRLQRMTGRPSSKKNCNI